MRWTWSVAALLAACGGGIEPLPQTEEGTTGQATTGGGGGTQDSCVVFAAAADCSVLTESRSSGSAQWTVLSESFYDECGRVEAIDTYVSAQLQQTTEYTYLGDGQLDRIQHDGTDGFPPDGIVDLESLYAYEDEGRLSTVTTEYPLGGGTPCVSTFSYLDPDDLWEQELAQCQGDQPITHTYAWDTALRELLRVETDDAATAGVDSATEYTWEAAGVLAETRYLNLQVSSSSTLTTYTNGPDGPDLAIVDVGIDGFTDANLTWTYVDGRPETHRYEDTSLSTFTEYRYTWSCGGTAVAGGAPPSPPGRHHAQGFGFAAGP